MIFVDLSSFRSSVTVADFQVWQWARGVKPSRPINLACIANVSGNPLGRQARWNTDGSVTLIGGLAPGQIIHCFQKIMPVPSGVTFA